LRDDRLLEGIEQNFEKAGLSNQRLAMLRYAVKLTVTPAEMTAEDVAGLRAVGFTDIDILHIVEVVGYYAYANRVADGLGLPMEEWIPGD
jgi:uncharacterized peroxidase-related enzyme